MPCLSPFVCSAFCSDHLLVSQMLKWRLDFEGSKMMVYMLCMGYNECYYKLWNIPVTQE